MSENNAAATQDTNQDAPPSTAPDSTTTAPPKAPPSGSAPAQPQVISMEDALKLVEKARKQEKDALYPRLDDEKKKREDLEATIAQMQEDSKTQREALLRAAGVEPAPDDPGPDNSALSDQLKEMRRDMEAQKDAAAAMVVEAQLDAYLEVQVEKADLWPEFRGLVKGDTKEEIRASIEEQRASQKAIAERLNVPAPPAADKRRAGMPGPPPTAPTKPNANAQANNLRRLASRGDPEAFERARAEMADRAGIAKKVSYGTRGASTR